jgi:hypothetical protein
VFASGWKVVLMLAGVRVLLRVRVTVLKGEGEGGVGVLEGDAVMVLDGVIVDVGLGVGDDEGSVSKLGVRVGLRDDTVRVDVGLGVGDAVRELEGVCVTDGVVESVGVGVAVTLAVTETVDVVDTEGDLEPVADMVRLGQAELESDTEGEGVVLSVAEAEMLAEGTPSKARGAVGFSSSSGNWRSSAESSPRSTSPRTQHEQRTPEVPMRAMPAVSRHVTGPRASESHVGWRPPPAAPPASMPKRASESDTML